MIVTVTRNSAVAAVDGVLNITDINTKKAHRDAKQAKTKRKRWLWYIKQPQRQRFIKKTQNTSLTCKTSQTWTEWQQRDRSRAMWRPCFISCRCSDQHTCKQSADHRFFISWTWRRQSGASREPASCWKKVCELNQTVNRNLSVSHDQQSMQNDNNDTRKTTRDRQRFRWATNWLND